MDTNRQQTQGQARVHATSVDGFLRTIPKRRPAAPKMSVPLMVTSPKPKSVPQTQLKPSMAARELFPVLCSGAPKSRKRAARKKASWRVWVLRSGVFVLVVLLITGGFFTWKGYAQLHKVFRGTSTVAALSAKVVDPDQLKGEGDGRVNILLLGVGGAGHDGPDLTDTILILSVDPVNNAASLLSVPRDLWVKMPVSYFGQYEKINAAYSSGKYSYLKKLDPSNANAAAVEAGFASIDQTMSEVLGVKINYHVLVNFQAFRQAIDTVGGVTIDVKDQLYDPTMAWENNWNSVLAAPGVQVMDGKKALLYARSRETSSDFARSERQRQIIVALKDKVLSAGTLSNPAKIEGLMNAFGDNVYSDLSTQGASRLYSIMHKIDDGKIMSLGLSEAPNKLVTTDHVGNTSVVRPVAGFNDYTAIQTYVHSQLVDGYIAKENAAVAVLAPTQASATEAGATLKSYGYNVTSMATGGSVTQTTLVDSSEGKAAYTKHYLEARYGVKSVAKLPVGTSVQPTGAKFVIILNK